MTDAVLVVAFLAGVVLLAVGAWMVLPAAGLIVAGVLLVGVPLLYARGKARSGS